MIAASEVPRQDKIGYIWRDRFPIGAISVIGGREGEGKSLLTCAIAAEVSQTDSVIFSNGEDPLCGSRSRIEAAGGDLDRIYFPEMEYLFPRDLAAFEEDVQRVGAKLAIFDAAAQYLPHLSSDQAVRRATTPLTYIAEDAGLAVLFVAHTLRSARRSQDIRHTIQGPALTRAARCLAIFGKVPGTSKRGCCFVKDNFREPPSALVFDLEEVIQGTASVARLVVIGESEKLDPFDLVIAPQAEAWTPRRRRF